MAQSKMALAIGAATVLGLGVLVAVYFFFLKPKCHANQKAGFLKCECRANSSGTDCACNDGYTELGGKCVPTPSCGYDGTACCDGGVCIDPGTTCQGGKCVGCDATGRTWSQTLKQCICPQPSKEGTLAQYFDPASQQCADCPPCYYFDRGEGKSACVTATPTKCAPPQVIGPDGRTCVDLRRTDASGARLDIAGNKCSTVKGTGTFCTPHTGCGQGSYCDFSETAPGQAGYGDGCCQLSIGKAIDNPFICAAYPRRDGCCDAIAPWEKAFYPIVAP